MPLSEHEQRLLEQLEQQLHADDPKFADSLGSEPRGRVSTRHVILGVLISVVGLVCVLFGVSSGQFLPGIAQMIIGLVGFVIMGVGVYVAILRGRGAASAEPGGKSKAKKSNFMNNLEQRWDERRREN